MSEQFRIGSSHLGRRGLLHALNCDKCFYRIKRIVELIATHYEITEAHFNEIMRANGKTLTGVQRQ